MTFGGYSAKGDQFLTLIHKFYNLIQIYRKIHKTIMVIDWLWKIL